MQSILGTCLPLTAIEIVYTYGKENLFKPSDVKWVLKPSLPIIMTNISNNVIASSTDLKCFESNKKWVSPLKQ